MAILKPFRAIRYSPGADPALVTAPPYDVISPDERRRLEEAHEHNIVRVTLPSDLPGRDKYTDAGDRFREWLRSGVLVAEAREAFYLYRMDYRLGGSPAVVAGVLAVLPLEPFGEDVLPHERTMPGPKAGRLALMRTTRANLEPLWLVLTESLRLVGTLIDEHASRSPIADFVDPGGVRHRMWPLGAFDEITEAAAGATLVVADGHHRYETAVTYRDERRATDGPGPWDEALVLVSDPADHPPALRPIHRLAAGLRLEDVKSRAHLQEFLGSLDDLASHVVSRGAGAIGVADRSGRWTMRSPGPLDTAFLDEEVLRPLGADVAYEHRADLVAQGIAEGRTGFLLAPVRLEAVLEAAAQRRRMPPKTTLFWPKPRSGLVLRDVG